MITNSQLIEKVKEDGVYITSKWLYNLSIIETSESAGISNLKKSYDTLTQRTSLTQRTYEKCKVLNKSKSQKGGQDRLESFLSSSVSLPKRKDTSTCSSSRSEKSENVIALQQKVECLETVVTDVVLENKVYEEKLRETQENSKIRLKRLSELKKLKISETNYKDAVKHLNISIKSLQNRIVSKNAELKRLRLKVSYADSCISKKGIKLESALHQNEDLQNELRALKDESDANRIRLEKQLQDTVEENDYLRQLINDNITTYDEHSRKFTPELQQCVYDLLNLNVSFTNVSPVIESVLNLVKIRPNRLPCKSTVNNMNVQRLALSQKHIAYEFTPQKETCLLSDETNKFGKKMEGIHAADKSGNIWVLGVREIVTKSGKDVLQSLLQILGDIDAISESSDNPASRQILKNISSTMSDRAKTQIKFNELLEQFRTDILKEDLGDKWENMTNEEQLSISKLCNFFCSLHALVHMAETCSKALLEYEIDSEIQISEHAFKSDVEPGTVRLVRTVCKAFSRGGDEKNGQHLNFYTYSQLFLNENGLKCVPLERFRGNRFNILFRNAASVFFLREQLKGYLSIEHSNRLLASVYHDINVPEYLAGCKALGLISELITVPFWCMIEDENIHIIEAQERYQELVQYLEELPQHLDSFIEGTHLLSFVNQEKLALSKELMSLTKEWEHDGKVLVILRIMIPALGELCKKLFHDFLPNGLWFHAPESVKTKTESVPKHNKFSETIFGHMDRLLREKPNTTMIASEANMMFVHNKTNKWLRDKSDKERQCLISQARKDVKHLRYKFKERNRHIEFERQRLLAEKREKAEETERNRIMKRENITDAIQLWGLWQSEEEVDSGLACLKTKTDKTSALKAPLTFRKKVFEQKADKSVYRVSKKDGDKNVPLSIEELTINVKKLVRKAYEIENVEHDQVIVGKRVKHAFKDENKNQPSWFIGQVISQVPGFPKWFDIKYSGDVAIYSYQLLNDLQTGDLKILV